MSALSRFFFCLACAVFLFATPLYMVRAQDDAEVPGADGGQETSGLEGGDDTSEEGGTGNGTCRFNCTPQIESATMPCTTRDECVRTCTDRCPALVDRGGCAETTAQCVDLGGGRKGCAFDCIPQIEYSCTTGDAGTAECGRGCNERCRPPGGGQATVAIRCSQLAPTCVARSNPSAPTAPREQLAGSIRLTNPIRGADSIPELVGKIIKGILGIVGGLALLMFVYGGMRWIWSAGDVKEVQAAQGILQNATIGLILIFSSYGLSSLVLGLVREIGGSSSSSAPSAAQSNESLASCVQEAVRRRTITLNDARERTNGGWSCRATTEADRASGSSTCVRSGCPGQPATVLCCAPSEETAPRVSPGGVTLPSGGAGAGGVTRDTAGPQGSCACGPSVGGGLIGTLASADQIAQARNACQGPPANGRFDASAFTCTGRSTERECRTVETELNRLLTGIPVSAECRWTRE